MELIDKAALVAEIEKKIKQYKNERNTIIKDTDNSKELASRIIMCQEIISFLDTIEVKEVDLEKEYDNEFFKDPVFGKLVNRNAGISIAKHFFELGLKSKEE